MSQTSDIASQTHAAEPTLSGPFEARVKGFNARGVRFKFATVLENLSAGRCEVRLEGVPEPGPRISVVARVNRALIALSGHVLAVSSLAGGPRRAAVHITRYRFVHLRPPAGTDPNSP